jgi:hypothetical protein
MYVLLFARVTFSFVLVSYKVLGVRLSHNGEEKNPFSVIYSLFQVLVLWVTISDSRHLNLQQIIFPKRSSGNVAKYHGTFHGTPQQKDSLFLSTFKISLSEEENTSTIYVCS